MGFKRDQMIAVLILLPSILLIALFVYGFIGNTVYVSMTDWGKNAALALDPEKNFVGLKNYGDLFSGFLNGRFRQDLVNAVFYSFFLVGGSLVFGLFLAVLLDRNPKGERFFQTIFLFPLSLSFIVSGTIWRWLLAPKGGLNVLPVFVGLPKLEFGWLSSLETVLAFNWQYLPRLLVIMIALMILVISLFVLGKGNRKPAIVTGLVGVTLLFLGIFGKELLPTILFMEEIHGLNLATLGIIIAAVWQYSGYTMALFLAGLRGIPKDLVKAARLDGASEWQYYRRIAIPMLKPITLSAIIILSHISLKIFDLIFAMTGPDNVETGHPSLLMYLTTFRANQFAKGAAIAVVLFILAAIFIVPYIVSSYHGRKAAEL
jgi:glucose/mannose transport system permease protein